MLQNKLGITDQIELAKAEERIRKQKAKQLFDSGDIDVSYYYEGYSEFKTEEL